LKRAYYSNSIKEFLKQDEITIFGEIVSNDQFSAQDLQKNTWKREIEILKRELSYFESGHILFEYTIPRIGNRIDNVFIYKGIIFLLEFKVGEKTYPNYAIEQVTDYALDLNSFHKESHNKLLVPILVSTEAAEEWQEIKEIRKNILETHCCNELNIHNYIQEIVENYNKNEFNPIEWVNSIYMPTPTIIQAAQVLYNGHNVKDISRNDASAINLNKTTEEINEIIDNSKVNNRKSICFITGVPGAGKTLAGLNIAIERQKIDKGEHAVFLSGNGPLVDVLREALARDDVERNKTTKKDSLRKAEEFIQKMKKKHYDATHVCSCYVYGDNNEITRANDDGEPSGTAGAPMLDVLVKNEIKNVCATVIRYYGGTKLGTGGLVRAYGGGVINALKNATLVERKDAFEVRLELDYSLNGKIEYEIGKTNFIVNNLEYTDKIVYTIYVMQEDYDNFENWIANLTNGQFKILSSKEKQLEFDIK